MSQPLDPTLAPAMASADATVASLQGAPAAPMPNVGQPPPAAAGAPPAAAPAAPAPPAAPGVPGGTNPVGDAVLARVPGLAEKLQAQGAKAAGGAKLIASGQGSALGTPEQPAPGMVQTGEQQVLPATPGQVAFQAGKLGEAQAADEDAARLGVQNVQRQANIDYFTKRAAQQLAEERYRVEKEATDAIQERVRKQYEETAEGELEPDRIFSGGPGSAWAVISTVLGVLIGGAAMAKHGAGGAVIGGLAMGLKSIDKAIRDDLSRQKEAKNSRLRHYETVLGDQNLAYQRLHAQGLNIAAMQAETAAAEARARGLNSADTLAEVAAQLRAKQAREEAQFGQDVQIKTSREWMNEKFMKQPGGPAKPALSPLTAAENQILAEEDVDEATWKEYRALLTDNYNAPTLESVATMQTAIEGMTGQDVKGLGKWDEKWALSQILASGDPKAAEIQQVVRWLDDNFLRGKTGANAPPAEKEEIKLITQGRATLADLKRGLEIVRRHASAQIKAFENNTPRVQRAAERIRALQPRKGPTEQRQSAPLPAPPPEEPSPVDNMLLGDDAPVEERRQEQLDLRQEIQRGGYGD